MTDLPTHRTTTHPGIVLLEDFLVPLRMSQSALAHHLGVPVQRINAIVRGKRGITPDLAVLLAMAFKTSAEFWMNLQTMHDLTSVKPARRVAALVG